MKVWAPPGSRTCQFLCLFLQKEISGEDNQAKIVLFRKYERRNKESQNKKQLE